MTYSVVIPNYNRYRTLCVAIESVLLQSVQPNEIIVVDDCSPKFLPYDKIRKIDPRINVIFHSENQGVSAARNTGYINANSDVVMFLDSDDRWHPEKARILFPLLKNFSVAVHDFDSNANVLAKKLQDNNANARKLTGLYPYLKNHVQGSAICISKEHFPFTEPFNVDYRYSEDFEFFLRLKKHNVIIMYTDHSLTNLGRPNGVLGGLSGSHLKMRKYEQIAIEENITNPLFKYFLLMFSKLKQIRKRLIKK